MTRNRLPGERRLFAPEELAVEPSPWVRLRELAARAPRRAEPGDARREEDRRTIERMREWGGDLARRFALGFMAIDAEKEGVVAHYGICYEDGLIRIRLRHARTGKLLKESSLVDTLCHELAHLRYMDHSVRFRKLYARILNKARQLGYYRPGPDGRRKPRQLSLFDVGACGTTAIARKRGRSHDAGSV